jgi:hypothetical protein
MQGLHKAGFSWSIKFDNIDLNLIDACQEGRRAI